MQVIDIDIKDIRQFSKKDKAYIGSHPDFENFLNYKYDFNEFEKLIQERSKYQTDRKLLVSMLKEQYGSVSSSLLSSQNIENLAGPDCFTITTAHQPSLMSGPLYYVYKILSAIKLCKELSLSFPNHKFVPLFVLGGEDHDFEEINHLHLYQKKIEWQSNDSGSVDQYSTEGLETVIHRMIEILGERSLGLDILNSLKIKLSSCKDYNEFAFLLTHSLFDHLGLIILKMDTPGFKRQFSPIVKAEILNQKSKTIVNQTQKSLEEAGWDSQAFARQVNFFYRIKGIRNRIDLENGAYKILDSDISFTPEEIENEISNHPENFSPNVIMRPLFQEMILPNLAYIGGGGEIAYWLERKAQFEHFNIHFPMLIRRTSALIIGDHQSKQLEKLGLSILDLFKEKEDLIKYYLEISDSPDYKLDSFKSEIEATFKNIEAHVSLIDKSLEKTTQSEAVKAQKSLDYLQGKLKKSIKQKEEINLKRIDRLVDKLFPGGLQERHDNIFEYISNYGPQIIDQMLEHCMPFDKKFKVFLMSQE